jgi:Fe-S cluster assembly ATP-binding protein
VAQFRKRMQERMALLEMAPDFARRYLNEGFSGGEKKRLEILQMAMLEPAMAIMDETDSGLDIDALRIVANGVNTVKQQNPAMGVLVITHYQRLLNYIKPDMVHVLMDGQIVREGGPEMALELEEKGYDFIREEVFGNAS